MAFTKFVIQKYAALILTSLLTTIGFFVGTQFYGLLMGIGFLVGGMFLGIAISLFLLNNPFTAILEGRGLLALSMDSTGIITPFVIKVNSPYINGKFRGKPINDIFDRETVMQLAKPETYEQAIEFLNDGTMRITLTQEGYNKAKFAMYHYPVLIYNDQLKSLITKDLLSETEKTAFAEHNILYLNRKVEELSAITRDFARYIVESLKPNSSIFANKWLWIIIIIVLGVLAAIFAPSIISAIKGATG